VPCPSHPPLDFIIVIIYGAGHSGRAVWGVGLGRLVAGIVGSNPAQGMDVCPRLFSVVLSCVGRGLATGWSLVQRVVPYVEIAQETSCMWGGQGFKKWL
jgi:hypothetical protein